MNKLILLITSILCVVLQPKVSMSNPNQTCISNEPRSSYFFASSVAVNEKYLAVGDIGANKVIIYTRNNSEQWIRSKEILPPQDSTPYKLGRGFGGNLQLDGDVLVIGAFTQQQTKEVTNPEYFQQRTILMSTFEGRYITRLDRESKVEPIELLIERETGLVKFNLLSNGKIKQITVSDNGERGFASSVALHKNLLLVGTFSSYEEKTNGGAWLYDINTTPPNPIIKLTDSNALLGGSVAISEQFAVVGHRKNGGHLRDGHPMIRKTLIRNLNNGSTRVIDRAGRLSISGNILARMHPRSRDPWIPTLLEVFRLDENAEPHLFIRRENLLRAWVQNGFLITVQGNYDSGIEVCLESVE